MLKCDDATQVDAEKSSGLLVRPAVEGEIITVYTETGEETKETGHEGMYVTTAADINGNPILNAAGQPNTWIQGEENLFKKYDMENIREDGFIKPKGGIQHFIQTDRNIAIMKPWGANGEMVPQFIDAGGYLNITDEKNIYGVGESEFGKLYTVVKRERNIKPQEVEIEEDPQVVEIDSEPQMVTIDDAPNKENSSNDER